MGFHTFGESVRPPSSRGHLRLTMTRGGRQRHIDLSPVRLALLGLALAVFLALEVLAGFVWLGFGDFAAGAVRREAELHEGFEARIARMRADYDSRVAAATMQSSRLETALDDSQARELHDLVALQRRIVSLEGELGTLRNLVVQADMLARAGSGARTAGNAGKGADHGSPEDAVSQTLPRPNQPPAPADDAPSLSDLDARLDTALEIKSAIVASLEHTQERRARFLSQAMAGLGLLASAPAMGETATPITPMTGSGPWHPPANQGGPFIAASPGTSPGAGDEVLLRTQDIVGPSSLVKLQHLTWHIQQLQVAAFLAPLGDPAQNAVVTSPFGTRRDPFTGARAHHAGIDFRMKVGDPVSAAAPGHIIFVGKRGGYGYLVEIGHAHGVVTRYGHLSEILVEPGAFVARGDVVALSGNTGRSTGPHLHYEIVVEGRPVNPRPWLDAGRKLAGAGPLPPRPARRPGAGV